jgi:hypothetical protein
MYSVYWIQEIFFALLHALKLEDELFRRGGGDVTNLVTIHYVIKDLLAPAD